MTTALQTSSEDERGAQLLHRYMTTGDMTGMTPDEELMVMNEMCLRLGLDRNALPFAVMSTKASNTVPSRRILYPKKECAEQLRTKRKMSFSKPDFEVESILQENVHKGWNLTCYAHARTPDGTEDVDIGCVFVTYPNQIADGKKRALSQAKRRVTFSMGGLGAILDIAQEAPEPPSAAFDEEEVQQGGEVHEASSQEAQQAEVKDPPLKRFIDRCAVLKEEYPVAEAYYAILQGFEMEHANQIGGNDTEKMKLVIVALEAGLEGPESTEPTEF